MTFDPHRNFGYSTVATAPSPANSGTSLIVQTGDGALFPAPSTDGAFNLTVWPAGAVPTSTNAEIVRCTARSSDTFTITRTQEATGARSILVGDQVALSITAKIVTDIEAQIDPGIVVVAAPTGVAATDNAAIAAAITACPVGGIVQLQAGTYAITGLTIAKVLTLRGHGGANAGEKTATAGGQVWTSFGTLLTLDSATATAITVSSHNVRLENFALQNTHATAPTSSVGIKTVSGGGNSTHYGPDLSIRGFFINVDHQAGGQWVMEPSCFLLDFVSIGLRMQNVDDTDFGDMSVSGMFYGGPTNATPRSCIQWVSGGGFKGYSIKTNIYAGVTLDIGIELYLQDGIGSSDFLLTNSSIENSAWGVLLQHAGPSNTGTFTNIVIVGNQFFTNGSTATQVIAIAPTTGSKVSEVNVGGNVIHGGPLSHQNGVYFKNVDNATHGPNVFTIVAANYNDAGGNTNITSVGAG